MALKIEARIREKTGKSENRRLIKEGFVPANLVMPNKNEALALAIPVKEAREIAKTRQRQLEIEVADSGKRLGTVKDIVWDVLIDRIRHIDLIEVDEKEPYKAQVPLFYRGKDDLVTKGGIFVVVRDFIEVVGLWNDIPDRIAVTVADMEIPGSLKVGDLEIPDEVELLTPDRYRVCEARSLKAVRAAAQAVIDEAEEAAAEAEELTAVPEGEEMPELVDGEEPEEGEGEEGSEKEE